MHVPNMMNIQSQYIKEKKNKTHEYVCTKVMNIQISNTYS